VRGIVRSSAAWARLLGDDVREDGLEHLRHKVGGERAQRDEQNVHVPAHKGARAGAIRWGFSCAGRALPRAVAP